MLLDELKLRVPHRYPILLIDRIDRLDAHREISASKAVTCNEPWYRHLGADAPASAYAYPVPLIIESWCQSAGVLALWSSTDFGDIDDKAMLFGSITDIGVLRSVYPGERLDHWVRLVRATDTTFVFEGRSSSDGRPVLEVSSAVVTIRDRSVLAPSSNNEK